MTTYKGYAVLDVESPNNVGRSAMYDRAATTLNAGTGKRTVDDRGIQPRVTFPFSWMFTTRTELAALRSWVDARKGRQTPFWVPTYRPDLVISTATVAAVAGVTIKSCSYTRQMYPHLCRRYLAFMPRSGAAWTIRQVTSAVDNGNGTEGLTLDSAIGSIFSDSNTMVSYLLLCRLADDSVDIEYFSAISGEANMRFTEVRREVPA